jgi:peptidylprolyl isomerase
MTNTAQTGQQVAVHYTGRLANGSTFDSSVGAEPLQFQLGAGTVIPGFDNGILGMQIGQTKTINIPFAEAYGPVIAENILTIPRSEIPADLAVELGSQLNMHQDGEGQVIQVTVTELTSDSITLDANHPLAGQDLIFDLELVAIL